MTKALKRMGAALAFGLLLMSGVALAHPNHEVMGTVTMVAADIKVGTRLVVTAVSDNDLTAKAIEIGVAPAATK